jgi:putative transcriptional regulator
MDRCRWIIPEMGVRNLASLHTREALNVNRIRRPRMSGEDSRTARSGGSHMKDATFQELLTSIRQAGKIRRSTLKPGRVMTFRPAGVKAVHDKLKASRTEFALIIGVSGATLRNLELDTEWPGFCASPVIRRRSPRRCTANLAKAWPNNLWNEDTASDTAFSERNG